MVLAINLQGEGQNMYGGAKQRRVNVAVQTAANKEILILYKTFTATTTKPNIFIALLVVISNDGGKRYPGLSLYNKLGPGSAISHSLSGIRQ
jgi:hypothetical protein